MSALLNLAGLALTGWGAFIAARAVILTSDQATQLSGSYWDENPHLKAALIAQSSSAWKGLMLVVAGTAAQALAIVVGLLK